MGYTCGANLSFGRAYALHMVVPDEYVPLHEDVHGVSAESRPRHVQNGGRTWDVSLNKDWLELLELAEQGAPTVHAVSVRGKVRVEQPAYIIQPAAVVPGVEVDR